MASLRSDGAGPDSSPLADLVARVVGSVAVWTLDAVSSGTLPIAPGMPTTAWAAKAHPPATSVARLCYSDPVATTTVRLDPDEERVLDELASKHGGRSNALRVGLKLLAAEAHRQTALADLLADWDRESGPVSDDDVLAMSERYGLAP